MEKRWKSRMFVKRDISSGRKICLELQKDYIMITMENQAKAILHAVTILSYYSLAKFSNSSHGLSR